MTCRPLERMPKVILVTILVSIVFLLNILLLARRVIIPENADDITKRTEEFMKILKVIKQYKTVGGANVDGAGLISGYLRAWNGIFRDKMKSKQKFRKSTRMEPDTRVHLPGEFPLYQQTEGCMFSEHVVDGCFRTALNVTLLKFLSPLLENLAIRHFMGVPGDNLMYANSPAIIQEQDGNFTLVARMWQEAEAYFWLKKRQKPLNVYQDNLFFTVRLNNKLEPLDKGHFMGIPSPQDFQIGAGPIEPRLFKFKNRQFVSYNTGFRQSSTRLIDYTFIWDFKNQYLITPQISGGGSVVLDLKVPVGEWYRDKHWMALEDRGSLYLIQTLEPLRVLKCNVTDEINCAYVGERIPIINVGSVRGGSPFVLYEWPYYISVTHSTVARKFDKNTYKRFYVTNILVLSVHPVIRIVYMSEGVNIHPQVMKSCPIVRSEYIKDEFFFPVSLHLESQDSAIVGGHLNDHTAAVVRIAGLKKMMSTVMLQDKNISLSVSKARKVVQQKKQSLNDFVIRTSARATGYNLVRMDF